MEEVNGLHAQLKTSLSSFAEEIDKQVALLTTKETAREKYIKIDEGHLSKDFQKQTAKRGKHPFLCNVACGKWPCEDGVYFIDRNPLHFDRIYRYLETGKFEWEGLDLYGTDKLVSDLDFYQIQLPPELVRTPTALIWEHSSYPSNIIISDNGRTVRTDVGNGPPIEVWANRPASKFTIKQAVQAASVGFRDSEGRHKYSWNLMNAQKTEFTRNVSCIQFHQPVHIGAIVTVEHDKEKREIRYIVDGREMGTAFREVPDELYPYVILSHRGSTVTLVE